jgi:dienelactone hydrolase
MNALEKVEKMHESLEVKRSSLVLNPDGNKLIPARVVLDGLDPFLKQAVPPYDLPEDKLNDLSSFRRLFSYAAPSVPLSPLLHESWSDGNVLIEHVDYQTGPLTRATAFVLKPEMKSLPFPGILLFHCHSGVYRWGKEKMLARAGDPTELRDFRQLKYSGQSLAKLFAERGFVVIVPDAFYFGQRALGCEGIDAPSREIDLIRKNSEHLIAKMLFLSGHSWPALIAWEDRRALDYLYTQSEVDRDRIGCLGLSFGGFRSMMLAAQDRRIGAVVTAGWLTTLNDLLGGKIANQSWMVLPWGMLPDLDFPALASQAWPAAFLALLCTQDHLFTLSGMRAASEALASHYRHAGDKDLCRTEFFNSPHCMNESMQDQAIQWMERFLGGRKPQTSKD